jgi:hypothetical protein
LRTKKVKTAKKNKSKRMKSIKEKAAEYRRVIEVINEHESLVDTQGSEMFEEGADYVLEQVEMLLNSQRFVDNPSQELYELIEQLKK